MNAVAPRIEAELPARHFRGSRLQGFVPPVTAGPACTIRKPPVVVYSLDDYVGYWENKFTRVTVKADGTDLKRCTSHTRHYARARR